MKLFQWFRKNKNAENEVEKLRVQFASEIETIKAQGGFTYQGHHSYYNGYGNNGSKWHNGIVGGSAPILNHNELRKNSRNAYHDTPLAKAIVDRYADRVGTGLKLESTPDTNILGITPEEGEKWGTYFESSFALWANSKAQHRAGLMTFNQAHRLYSIQNWRDGDIFVRLYYNYKDKTLLNPLQFEFYDPNQIRGYGITDTNAPYYQDDGIIRDSQGREKAYRIWVTKKKSDGQVEYIDKEISRISRSGRIMMLHCFSPEYAGQLRGYPRISHILQDFQNLTNFKMSQIMKAISQSNVSWFVKPSKDEDSSNPLEGILSKSSAGPIAEQFGSDPKPSPEAKNIGNPVKVYDVPEASVSTPGSTVVANLQAGEEVKPFSNTAPSESFNSFVSSFASYLSASCSMPLEIVLMKFNENYSASRAALILFYRVGKIWDNEMSTDCLDPTVEMWACGEIAAGRIVAPGWHDPRLRAAWLKNNWIGEPMPNIDPQKTAKADEMYVGLGAQTLDVVARNLNGSSGKANRAKLKKEFEELPTSPFNSNVSIEEGEEKEEEKPKKNE